MWIRERMEEAKLGGIDDVTQQVLFMFNALLTYAGKSRVIMSSELHAKYLGQLWTMYDKLSAK